VLWRFAGYIVIIDTKTFLELRIESVLRLIVSYMRRKKKCRGRLADTQPPYQCTEASNKASARPQNENHNLV
jgi:hypothetical protein